MITVSGIFFLIIPFDLEGDGAPPWGLWYTEQVALQVARPGK